ncbi:MAG TPA: hypothetical protein VMA73_23440, partial [Streptosporangiaceae bacterium]|nr:hypothetical protein [Streptosporangiaceae bacterium]
MLAERDEDDDFLVPVEVDDHTIMLAIRPNRGGEQRAELSAALAVLLHININVSTPPVSGTISGTVSPSGDLALNFTHPTFPSLGLRVKIDGSVVLGGLVNDVSCLGPRQVLGVGGVVRLVTGLNTSTTTRLVA